jgi:hypothetical protein
LEEKLSKKLKNSHENFSGVRVPIVLGLLAWISEICREALRQINFSLPLLSLLVNFYSKMMFLNSKKAFQS